jgi:hypothetical protein
VAELTVFGNGQWFGDPRLGTVVVYVDGIKRGRVSPGESLLVTCAPGRHEVRVRQWWYMSPRIDVEIQPEQQTILKGGINQTGSIIWRILVTLFMPWRAMTLAQSPGSAVTGNYAGQAHNARIWGLGIIAGLTLALVGVNSNNVPLMVIGGAGYLLSQGLVIRQAREFRRFRR